MDFVATTSATSNPPVDTKADTKSDTKTTKADPKTKLTAFEGELKKAGAKLKPVEGHAFEKVVGGKHDGEFVNTSGNVRTGQLFELLEKDGHTYHVYGTGKDRQLFKVDPKPTGGATAP